MDRDFIYETSKLYEAFEHPMRPKEMTLHGLEIIRKFVSSFDEYKGNPFRSGLNAVLEEVEYPLNNFEKYMPHNIDTEESYNTAMGFICIIKNCLAELLVMEQELKNETE